MNNKTAQIRIGKRSTPILTTKTKSGLPAIVGCAGLMDCASSPIASIAITLTTNIANIAKTTYFRRLSRFKPGVATIRAIATTPLRLWEFLAARGLLVLIFSIVISLLSTLILIGTGVDYLKVTLGAIFCSGIGILLGVLIGGVSDNQIKGIAIMKILIFPYTFIPVASIFVPERWQAFLYIFPNYWMFRILRNVFVDMNNPDFWFSSIITLAITAVLTVLFILTFRKRLKLK